MTERNMSNENNIPDNVKNEIKELCSSKPLERARAIVNLGKMRNQAVPAIPFLIEILGDKARLGIMPDGSFVDESLLVGDLTTVGEEASKALIQIGKPVFEFLITALKNQDPKVRYNALSALGGMKDLRAIEFVSAALKDESPQIRRAAAKTLGQMALVEMKDPCALEPLTTALRDEDPHVRKEASWALGYIKDSRAVVPLIDALRDDSWRVREKAAEALGEIGHSSCVGPLITALRDENSSVREKAAAAFLKIKDSRAIEPLIGALKDEYDIQTTARIALEIITGKDFGLNLAKWQEWWEQNKSQL